MNVLVVAAHPDDEVLGCGATVARHGQAGDGVYVLILGEGATSRHLARSTGRAFQEVRKLRKQAKTASNLLKVKKLTMASLPDNRFDSVDLLEIVKAVEKAIGEFRPKVVYTHFWADLNVDHRLTAQAVVTAARPIKGSSISSIYGFEVSSSTDWAFGVTGDEFRPNCFVAIDETQLGLKLRAMASYKDELRDWPHPRSLRGIETLARLRGSQAGVGLAEAFVLIREVKR